jgi:hypothetical protein
VNLLGVAAACVFLLILLMDRLCITTLVHITIEAVLSAQRAEFTAELLAGCTSAGKASLFHFTTAGVAFAIVSCGLLWLFSRRWRPVGWQTVCLGVLLAGSLAAYFSLVARVVLVEVPRVSPVMALHIGVPAVLRLAAACVLVLILATAVALRWSRMPIGVSDRCLSWRNNESRYYHERRSLLLILGGVALAMYITMGWSLYSMSQGWGGSDLMCLVYIMETPTGSLSLALIALAAQRGFSKFPKTSPAIPIEQSRLLPGLFAVVWTTVLMIVLGSVPLLTAWGLALWFQWGWY